MTGSVMAGKGVRGAIIWTPSPEILKAIRSRPGLLLAQLMASRKDPGPVSLVLVTRVQKWMGSEMPNWDVLPAASVAVAMILSPSTKGTLEAKTAVATVPA